MLAHHRPCRLLALFFLSFSLLLLLLFPSTAQAQPPPTCFILFDPYVPVRGYPMNVILHTSGGLNLTSHKIVLELKGEPSSIPISDLLPIATSMAFPVVLLLETPGSHLTVAVRDPDDKTICSKLALITSDLDLRFSSEVAVAASPSPATPGLSAAVANVTIANRGGHPAVALSCKAASEAQPVLTCSSAWCRDLEDACVASDLGPNAELSLALAFADLQAPANFTVTCSALNLPDSLVVFSSTVQVSPRVPLIHLSSFWGDAIAGSASIIDFTLSNQGQAPANNLSCLITVEDGGGGGGGGDGDEQHNQATFLEVLANCVNESSTQVRCGIEELKAAESSKIELQYWINPSVEEKSNLTFFYECNASNVAIQTTTSVVTTDVKGDLTLYLPEDSSISASGDKALLFKMMNNGPSYVRDASCTFAADPGAAFTFWSQLDDVDCENEPSNILSCSIARLSPQGLQFSLAIKLEDVSLTKLNISASCQSKVPSSNFSQQYVAAVETASPSPEHGASSDSSMVVIVTFVMVIGLIIVIVIWWRRRQERTGWAAPGQHSHDPFTEMESPSYRSD